MSISVLIADDHALIRVGIRQLLMTTPDIRVTGEVSDGDEVIGAVEKNAPDLLVMDVSMPGCHGEQLVAALGQQFPAMPILILSIYKENPIVQGLFQSGIKGYVTKDAEPEVLIEAIRKVASGGHFIDPKLVDVMISGYANPSPMLHESLSAREREIFDLLVDGVSVSEVANVLNISIKTVSTHKARIQKKLQVASTVEMVHYAIRHHLANGQY